MSTQPESVTVNVVDARNPRTGRSKFGLNRAVDDYLFEVRAGLDADIALREANCLAESIEALATEAVQGGMSAEVAYMVAFAADTIKALLSSIEGAHLCNEVQS